MGSLASGGVGCKHDPREWGAAWDPDAGILLAHRCLSAVQSRFLALGGRIVTGRVESVESTHGAGARITMQSGNKGKAETSVFDTAVVCAGPWTSKLLPQLAGC